jgi:hypothetical protein
MLVSWGDHPSVYVTGTVQLDATKLRSSLTQPRGSQSVQAVILHKIGHLAGLDHINDPAQLRYPRGGTATSYGPRDLADMAELGNSTCGPWL